MRPEKSIKSNFQELVAAAKLPEEIISTILVLLPVKPLIRFRCVCKSWRSLINDPYFIQKHLKHVTSMEYECETAILSQRVHFSEVSLVFKSMKIYKKEGEEGDNNTTPIALSLKDADFPKQYKPYMAVIRASCDGLLCVTLNRSCVLIWNPFIKVYKSLPSTCEPNTMFVYGIGYDSSIDDYKVVRASSQHRYKINSPVEVFALKSNSWKTVQDNFPYEISDHDVPNSNNGRIHWLAKRAVTKETVILYLDVVAEIFGEVLLPHGEDGNRSIILLLFGRDHLRFYSARHGSGQFELWEMKEYGVRESWSRLLITPQWPELFTLNGPTSKPFCFTRTGIILLRASTDHFVKYNLSDETFRFFTVDNYKGISTMIPCVESLVSPISSNII